ncbi:glycoside hydrolase family 32 protein [Mucilaginibacter sp.]|uniref:glycoside hydrolase family 32 protein n=1 Tax=Mucilaginibacter sp. TaxID=1882438 RepID=UPI003267E367
MFKAHRLKFFVVLLLLLTARCFNSQAQVTWHLDDTLLKSSGGRPGNAIKLSFHSRTNKPEIVKGYLNNGLRTDGYSTSLSAALPNINKAAFSVNGYFALETFPTDTAAFFAIGNRANWISACADRFGQLLICIGKEGKPVFYATELSVAKFKWLNVALSISSGNALLIVNGKPVRTVGISANVLPSDSLLIGRDFRQKAIGVFPVNRINGIVDEITIGADLKQSTMAALDAGRNKKAPTLAVSPSRFKGDFNRPAYHLLPAANWTNETHGLFYYKGKYHVFNQKNGANMFLGQINWGHFSSPDLLHWTEHKPALTPEPGYDENGIWSGCTVFDDTGKPVIIYSGGGNNSIGMCLAFPQDDYLLTWNKYPGNPVVTANPPQFDRKDFHDPIVWKDKGQWYMAVGFGLKENGIEKGTLLLYRSPDLKKWEYLHQLFTGNPAVDDSGVFWEMPLFWKMNGKYVLLVNKVPHKGTPALALYWTGDFIGEKFVPDEVMPKKLEVINRLLSPSVALDASGKTTAIAIIPDETSARETYQRGWTHLYSIPRIWNLQNGKINQSPHPVLEQLRSTKVDLAPKRIDSSSTTLLSEGSHQLELSIDIDPLNAKQFGLVVGKNQSGNEFTRIYFDVDKKQLVIDQKRSSLRKHVPLSIRKGDYTVDSGQKINLHLFIDGSVIEGFINNKDAFTTRLFPIDRASNRIELFTSGGDIDLLKASVWRLKNAEIKTGF